MEHQIWMEEGQHTFLVEMRSRRYMKSIPISYETQERVLFKGDLKERVEEFLVEDDVKFAGTNGVLKIDISECEFQRTPGDPDRRFTSAPRWGAIEIPRNM